MDFWSFFRAGRCSADHLWTGELFNLKKTTFNSGDSDIYKGTKCGLGLLGIFPFSPLLLYFNMKLVGLS